MPSVTEAFATISALAPTQTSGCLQVSVSEGWHLGKQWMHWQGGILHIQYRNTMHRISNRRWRNSRRIGGPCHSHQSTAVAGASQIHVSIILLGSSNQTYRSDSCCNIVRGRSSLTEGCGTRRSGQREGRIGGHLHCNSLEPDLHPHEEDCITGIFDRPIHIILQRGTNLIGREYLPLQIPPSSISFPLASVWMKWKVSNAQV